MSIFNRPKSQTVAIILPRSAEWFDKIEQLLNDIYEHSGLERVETTTRVYQGSTLISDSGPVVKYRQRARK